MTNSTVKRLFFLSCIIMAGCKVRLAVPQRLQEQMDRAERIVVSLTDDTGEAPAEEGDPLAQLVKDLDPPDTAMRDALINAMRRRGKRFNDLAELKQAGIIGESRDALVASLPTTKTKERTPERDALLEAENNDREAILAVYFACSSREVAKDKSSARIYRDMLRARFASALRKSAKPGEWVQHQDGKWVKR